MNWVRKIGVGILFIILINLLILLVISLNVKTLIVDGIIMEKITETITKTDYKQANEDWTEQINEITEDERVRELLKTKEVQDLVNKYLDKALENMANEEEMTDVELEKDILDYLNNNKEVLSEVVGEDITEEMIEKTQEQLEGRELSRIYKETISNTKRNLTEKEVIVLKGYNTLISTRFKILLVIGIILCIVLIALVQWSLTDWIKVTGLAFITSGSLTIIMSIIVKLIVSYLSVFKTMNVLKLILSGVFLIIDGIVFRFVYEWIMKKRRGDELDEVS